MNVRFKEQYSDSNPRMAYELVAELKYEFDIDKKQWCYKTKLIGLVPTYKMEITTDQTDIPATEVFKKLENIQNEQ